MKFDIIDITQSEINDMSEEKGRLFRAAQKKKDELYHKLQQDLAEAKRKVYANNTYDGPLLSHLETELKTEYEYRVAIVREQLEYDLKMLEIRNKTDSNGNVVEAPYKVDYSLSYIDRYAIVKAYYMSIEDPLARFEKFRYDKVALDYLASYYNTLFHYLLSLAQPFMDEDYTITH